MVELVMAELGHRWIMVEVMTRLNDIMNVRFETLWPLGILPGLVNLADRHSAKCKINERLARQALQALPERQAKTRPRWRPPRRAGEQRGPAT